MPNIDQRPIGVFDSGVGGLSILQELHKLLPNENFVFLADQLHVPYGEKSKKQLIKLCLNIVDYFIEHHNVKMVVVACNTATCGAIDDMRAKYALPIIGTVPVVKTATEKTKSRTIAIISTPSTSKSQALKKLIGAHSNGIKIINIGCKNLEDTVEHGQIGSLEVKKLLNKYLNDVKNSNADSLVLGCTHYPFLKTTIAKILGKKIRLLDSGNAVARRAKTLLGIYKIKNTKTNKGKTLYITTGKAEKFSKVASLLLRRKVKASKVAF